MSEEKKNSTNLNQGKKKHGFFNHLFKLITLGGLLVVIFKALQKSEEKKKK